MSAQTIKKCLKVYLVGYVIKTRLEDELLRKENKWEI